MANFVAIKIEPKKLGLKSAAARRINREVLTSMAGEWHEHYRERHFEEAATMRYGYALRKPGYVKRKRRLFGHNKPLVFTGQTLMLSRIKDIRGSFQTVRVILPRGLNRKHPKSNIRMRDEASRVLASEAAQLQDVGQITLGDQLAKNLT